MSTESSPVPDTQHPEWAVEEENMGYDAPFTTFTWAQWLEMQAKLMQCLTRYQRAIERHQAQIAMLIVLEMQDIWAKLHKEACSWIGSPYLDE